MRYKLLFLVLNVFLITTLSAVAQTTNELVSLSQNILLAVKENQPTQALQKQYENLDVAKLSSSLDTKEKKLSFWINTYNAFIQILLTKNPELYDDRGEFFSEPRMIIAGIEMSFDDMEHSLMRNSSNKLSGGYLKKWFEPKWVCKLRNEEIDPRIHFALNCGAKSCPAVAIYDDVSFEKDITTISKRFLKEKTSVKGDDITTTALISWFRGDFGGLSGAKELLESYGIIPANSDGKLSFSDYDWTLSLGDYTAL